MTNNIINNNNNQLSLSSQIRLISEDKQKLGNFGILPTEIIISEIIKYLRTRDILKFTSLNKIFLKVRDAIYPFINTDYPLITQALKDNNIKQLFILALEGKEIPSSVVESLTKINNKWAPLTYATCTEDEEMLQIIFLNYKDEFKTSLKNILNSIQKPSYYHQFVTDNLAFVEDVINNNFKIKKAKDLKTRFICKKVIDNASSYELRNKLDSFKNILSKEWHEDLHDEEILQLLPFAPNDYKVINKTWEKQYILETLVTRSPPVINKFIADYITNNFEQLKHIIKFRGKKIMSKAIVWGKEQLVSLLLQFGISPNAKIKDIISEGFTLPIFLAIKQNHAECVQELLNYDVDISVEIDGKTPLQYAQEKLKKIEDNNEIDKKSNIHKIVKILEERENLLNYYRNLDSSNSVLSKRKKEDENNNNNSIKRIKE